MSMSFPKMLQTLRDQGGRARRGSWDDDQWLELAPVPWNGEQEALLHHRPNDDRRNRQRFIVTVFLPFGRDIRAADWHWLADSPATGEEAADVETV